VASKKIMVVEDEGIVALDIQSKLENKGYEVPAVVGTGEEALQKTEETRPDLVLMDIQLEGQMDGVEAADQIRERFDIPVVYLTAYSDDSTLQRAKISEPFAYLLKPFEEKKLHTTIEIVLYKHQIAQEKTRLEAQLYQARKMEAIGRLTAGIAFNFTNMLQGIQGNLDLALMEATDQVKPFLEAADFDVQRAAQLVKQLMLFYQREQGKREPVRIAPIVEEVTTMCREVFARKYGRRIDISLQLEPDLPLVQGDGSQLRQCLTNLLTNAGDAVEKLGPDVGHLPRIDVVAETTRFQGYSRLSSAAATPEQLLRISIADNGIGMDEAAQEHLFEPFFTPQEADRGTGLGLAMVYAIVREHQGWIECESEPGAGTTFSLYLPVPSLEQGAEAVDLGTPEIIIGDEAVLEMESLRGMEKILLIADVDRFRKILTEILERHGYTVLVGLDVRDGLNIFQFEKEEIDLVILDLTSPGMSSQEIMNRLSPLGPAARILVVTGYTEDSSSWKGAKAVLNKPFKTYQLLRAVRQVLDS